MTVVFSTDQVYLHGGIEKVMADKANYFADVLLYNVYILATEQRGLPVQYALSSKIKLIDLKINYNRSVSYFAYSNLKKMPKHIFNLRKTIKAVRPDFVIVSNFAPDFYFLPIIKGAAAIIKEFHSSRFFEFQQRQEANFLQQMHFKLLRFVETKYNAIVVLNKDELQFATPNNSFVIANPIHQSNLISNFLSKKVIAAGRIAPVKNFENLIAIWQLVVQKEPLWQLHIYGDGDANYIASLQQIITDKNLSNHITIFPATSTMLLTMSNYSMYLMTSITECFPMVLLESLSVGLPIIAFDCPTGPRNIITNAFDGFLVESQNNSKFVDKTLYLIQNDALRCIMSKHARLKSEHFAIEIIMKQWIALFNKISNKIL